MNLYETNDEPQPMLGQSFYFDTYYKNCHLFDQDYKELFVVNGSSRSALCEKYL
jgi:hypothetical protein